MYNAVHQNRRQISAAIASAALVGTLAVAVATPAQAAAPSAALPTSLETAPVSLPAAVEGDDAEFSALLFTKTAGFRHANIPDGIAAIEAMAEQEGFALDTTEDGEDFTEENLANYDVVIWFSTTGDVLNDVQQAAFEQYIQDGGGFAGIHAASDTEYSWEWYEGLVGAYFGGHPAPQNGDLIVEDHVHPSTAHLPETWNRFDEWYSFTSNPRSDVHVLMSLDEDSYTGGTMGADHPAAWCHNYDGGRSWYTAGGHTSESFAEPAFLEHVYQGLRTAAGAEWADCSASLSDAYELVQLDNETNNPMSLEVAPDGTVFYIDRAGRVERIDAATQQSSTALALSVYSSNEDGLLGFVLDPDFETNSWAYIYYSPATVSEEDGPHNRISRFTYDSDGGTFDTASEQILLKVETQRTQCCHAGGDMIFDLEGNLILATGDNTNPFDSAGYTPIDERPGRAAWDAQGTSGNTNDLRGKLIRITPQDDGTYTIPEGNLFDASEETRPEIYGMGFRNPFRMGLDPHSGNILVADYGPDAGSASATRGPGGTTEWHIVSEAGNYGWPFCHGVKCYVDYNFATSATNGTFDPQALVNDSPNNTGLTNLPPVIQPEYWGETGAADNPWKQVGRNGYTGAPMGGPAYKFDPDLALDTKFPEYWDGKAFFGDWNDGEAFAIHLNRDDTDAPNGTQIRHITPMLPGLIGQSAEFYRVMDAQWGPNGSLYVIDWGSGFGGDNANSGIYRIDYTEGNPSPIARASADVTTGSSSELTVTFSSEGTRHPANRAYTLEWSFGDGSPTSTDENPTHTYTAVGEYTAQLTVTDEDDRSSVASVTIVVGNDRPTVEIVFPEHGGFFNWGDNLDYEVIVTDPDAQGDIDCENVEVLPALGHDSHQHPMNAQTGCEGTIQTQRDGGHGITENIFWVVDVRYTDDGGAAGIPLTGYATHVLNAKHAEAEFFTSTGVLTEDYPDNESAGVLTEATSDDGGGQNLSYVEPGDWWSYQPINFKGIDGMRARLAVPSGSGHMTLHWNAPDGPEVGRVDFTATGDWQAYEYFDATLTDLPQETGTLYFVHREGQVNVNYYQWVGDGVDGNSAPIIDLDADPVSGVAPLTVNATATATDPEGSDVTLEWDQGTGDGYQAGEASGQFVYDTPGTYLLRVRATDESDLASEEYVQIKVSHEVALCFDGRSDDFLGDQLDTERWNANVRTNQEMSVTDGELIIPATLTDIYGPGGDSPNLVLQDAPDGAWQATAKVTFPARAQYQQAGLLIYGDDDNYAKMVIQARDQSAAGRVFQFARENAGSAVETNTTALGAEYPDTVFVRIASDGETLTASYSSDGQTFTAVNETYALAGIDNPRIGLAAFANSGSPGAVVNAHFDWFHITPDNTSAAGEPNDEFDGTSLDACRWTVANEDADAYRVNDGALEIDPAAADIYQNSTGVTNFVVQDVPGDWTVETKVDASQLSHQYQQGGLIARFDDDNYVKINFVARNAVGSTLNVATEMLSEVDGAVTASGSDGPASEDGIVWLRLTKTGNVFTGATSIDGEIWSEFADEFTNAGAAEGLVGLFALGTNNQTETPTVAFDYFRVVGSDDPDPDPEPSDLVLDVTVSPGEPNGAAGWYTSAVTVDASVTGGGDSTVYRETKINDGGWNEYTAPIEVSADGEHTVQVRASSSDVDDVEESVSFKIDATIPTVSADADTSTHPRTLTVTGEDAGSGIDSLEYRIDAGDWAEFTAETELSDAAQSISARATDVAGNVSETTTIEVPAYDDGGDEPTPEPGPGLTFKDVNSSQTKFHTQIMWLANEGISRGWTTPTGQEFRPYSNINRDAMAAFLYRYAGSPAVTLPAKSPFVDITEQSQFYKEIVWLSQQGISTGWDTPRGKEFRPFQPITRDAMAAFLYRFADKPAWTAPRVSPFSDINSSTKFYKEITWLEGTGITTGWSTPGKPQYRPQATTNRDAMAAFLYRFDRL